jgi:prevent-host-death family protein
MDNRIAQRDLRNDSGDILRRVENGEEFVVTRNGTPIAELRPAPRRRGVARERVLRAFRGIPTVDLDELRADIDAVIDGGMRDPWHGR